MGWCETQNIRAGIDTIICFLTLGKYESDLHFKRKQFHYTIVGTIVSFLSLVIISFLSIKELRSVYKRDVKDVKLTKKSEIFDYNRAEFMERLDLNIVQYL